MTSIETGPTWSGRLNPRNWTLSWKLLAVGLVPALLALVLGVLRISDQTGSAADLGRSTQLLQVRSQVAAAADALRQERDQATVFVAGNRGSASTLGTGIQQTDAAVADMSAALDTVDRSGAGTTAARLQVAAGVAGLRKLRSDTATNAAVLTPQIRDRYTDVIADVDGLDRALLRQVRTPDTAGLADALTATAGATEQLALQHTVLGAAIRAGRLQNGDAALVASTDNGVVARDRDYLGALAPDQLARSGNFLGDPANGQRQQLENAIITSSVGGAVAVTPAQWDKVYTGSQAAINRSANAVSQDLATASSKAEGNARNLAGFNTVLLLLGLSLGILIAYLVARGVIRSLRVLRTSALDVAERRLPQAVESMRAGESPDVTVDPVPLDTRDEVGQVARAFDAVHGQAVRLAADQASLQSNVSAMFVNLSRRSQALVERQLQLIEQLESNEQDSDQLSNLFQLDHLATRMRRNSENLLVLAGTDFAKRNIAAVPMVDVLRAAVSEIEQYQRIVVQAPPTVTIAGRAGSDLVHLLAELLDNATNFSPPDSQVVMSTTRASDGSMLVEIADRGVGMIDHELSDANQRLDGPATVDVSASRRMGLFVVGRLGARHGIAVRLATSATGGPGAGLTASVIVPADLVSSTKSTRPAGVPQPAGTPARGGGVPPQRGTNGAGRPLSALVAGTDGPASSDGPLFAAPPPGGTNGSHGTNGLPSRRPGSSLRPEDPPPTERPDVAGSRPDDDGPSDAPAGASRGRSVHDRPVRGRPVRSPTVRSPTVRSPTVRGRAAGGHVAHGP